MLVIRLSCLTNIQKGEGYFSLKVTEMDASVKRMPNRNSVSRQDAILLHALPN